MIGDVMLDIIAAPKRAIELATDTAAEITLLPGGSGANQAAWLAHFGNAVRFAGRVGEDDEASHAAALRAHGVEPILARDPVARTGVLVTLIGAAGERSFLTDRGANARLSRADLADALLDGVDHVHVSGYALFSPGPRAAVREFLGVAAARDIPFSVDAGSAGFLRDVGPAAFLEWTGGAALCFVNAAEAEILADSSEQTEQRERLGARYETVIVTRGASGAWAVTSYGKACRTAAAPRVEAIDTSGAGDAFLAAFLGARLRGRPIDQCLEAGVRAGSSAVIHFGGRPPARNLPRYEDCSPE